MICFKCGAEIPEGSTICPVCHADLTLEFAQIDRRPDPSPAAAALPLKQPRPPVLSPLYRRNQSPERKG